MKRNTASKLTAWFELNKKDSDAARLLYAEIPSKYRFKNGRWELREKGDARGRIYGACPSQGERFYLRLMLTHIRGATCYEDLRTGTNAIQ